METFGSFVMGQATVIAILILAGFSMCRIAAYLRKRSEQRLWIAFMRLDRNIL